LAKVKLGKKELCAIFIVPEHPKLKHSVGYGQAFNTFSRFSSFFRTITTTPLPAHTLHPRRAMHLLLPPPSLNHRLSLT
jgi:hypothetical protein